MEESEPAPPNLDREEITVGLDEVCAVAEPLLRTLGVAERIDESDGRKVLANEASDTPTAELTALTEPTALPILPDGPRRAVPRTPGGAWAAATTETPAIFRPATARALLLRTPLAPARLPETEGENDGLEPLEPETAVVELEAWAEPEP